jgi:hypothetical protein
VKIKQQCPASCKVCCSSGYSECCNGKCVDTDYIRDGDNDCGDGSDETSPAFQCGASDVRILANGYEVEFGGNVYGTLSHQPVTGTGNACQEDFIALPVGATLAPDTAAIRANLVATYHWNTHVLILESGKGYETKAGNNGNPGDEFGDYQTKYERDGNKYRARWCAYEILYEIEKKSSTTLPEVTKTSDGGTYAPASDSASASGVLAVGVQVRLSSDYRDYSDASGGPLDPGETSEITEAYTGSSGYDWKVQGWWYMEEALEFMADAEDDDSQCDAGFSKCCNGNCVRTSYANDGGASTRPFLQAFVPNSFADCFPLSLFHSPPASCIYLLFHSFTLRQPLVSTFSIRSDW